MKTRHLWSMLEKREACPEPCQGRVLPQHPATVPNGRSLLCPAGCLFPSIDPFSLPEARFHLPPELARAAYPQEECGDPLCCTARIPKEPQWIHPHFPGGGSPLLYLSPCASSSDTSVLQFPSPGGDISHRNQLRKNLSIWSVLVMRISSRYSTALCLAFS